MQTITRQQVRKVFSRNRGAANQLAQALDISRVTVGNWLRGKMTSQRIAEAATAKAMEILEANEDAA